MPEDSLSIESFGNMADDFMLNIILLKKRDFQNQVLPFLHAHSLELASKAAALALGIEFPANQHNLRDLLSELSQSIDGLASVLPSEESYERYRELWLADSGPMNYELSNIPTEHLEDWELAYYVDNIVDLKYGTKKNGSLVSVLHVARPILNQKFKGIFRHLRSQYSDSSEIVQRALTVFGDNDSNRDALADIFLYRSA